MAGWIEERGKAPRIRYRGRIRVAGETLSTEACATKTEAKRLLRQLEHELDAGTWLDPSGAAVTFGEWAEAWIQTRGVLATSTQRADEGRLRTHLLPTFGDTALGDITPVRVGTFVSELSTRRAAKTVQHCHTLMHTIMGAAVGEGLIRKNPCTGTRLPKVARREHVMLTEQELVRLIGAFDDGWPRALVNLLAGTGMRWGEAAGLRVRCVDVLRRELVVRQTLTEVDGHLEWKDQPKTRRSYRSLTLPASVVDDLIPLVSGRHGDDLVFRTQECEGTCAWCDRARDSGHDPRLVHAVRNRVFRARHWDRARDAAGITSRPTPHDLRHTHVAMLIADGHGLPAIQQRLGHESIQITSDVYGYLLPRVDEGLIATLDRVLGMGRGAPKNVSWKWLDPPVTDEEQETST